MHPGRVVLSCCPTILNEEKDEEVVTNIHRVRAAPTNSYRGETVPSPPKPISLPMRTHKVCHRTNPRPIKRTVMVKIGLPWEMMRTRVWQHYWRNPRAILNDIWKGKIINSGASYSSFRKGDQLMMFQVSLYSLERDSYELGEELNIGRQVSLTADVIKEIPDNLVKASVDLHKATVDSIFYDNISKTGFQTEKAGSGDSFPEDAAKDRSRSSSSKAPENVLLRRPPVSRAASSHEGLSEVTADRAARGKSLSNTVPSDVYMLEFFLLVGARREGVNVGNADASGRRDAQFRRTSSCNDADVLETSFSDMLKSSAKKPAPQETHGSGAAAESSDGMAGGRNNKKKGKKGRQIDPALLGFKVTSNRIMMGKYSG
ncbi:UNVERIFIED_CONTAM: hypothetical protein Sradi_2925500 [Sesamum radiatum]|uniref:Uncharacterized protein n=1 Tax=Sesamum radiatum TaxID=300843 RepID=A0AAW2RZL0_SESRA